MSQASSEELNSKQYANRLRNNGIIQLTGDEKTTYLQGQITADMNKLSDSNALLACHCDFKGKMWSTFYTFVWQDSILLMPHLSVLDTSLSELNKYGVFSKVDITNQSDNWDIIGGCGSTFEKAIEKTFGQLPLGNREVVATENGIVMSIESPEQRYLTLQPKDASKKLDCKPSENDNQWEIADIKSGLGDIRKDTQGEFIPQMLNLQLLNAIDFEKGCYMGQEVVARTKYLGRNKRAGFILTSGTKHSNLSGEQLERQVGENWRPGGKILRSGVESEQTWVFAVLANDTEIGSTLRLKETPDAIFDVQAPPYPLQ